MPPPCLVAGHLALADAGQGGKFPTGRRTELVDGAARSNADLPTEGNAAGWLVGRAAHADDVRRDWLDQTRRNHAIRRSGHFVVVK